MQKEGSEESVEQKGRRDSGEIRELMVKEAQNTFLVRGPIRVRSMIR